MSLSSLVVLVRAVFTLAHLHIYEFWCRHVSIFRLGHPIVLARLAVQHRLAYVLLIWPSNTFRRASIVLTHPNAPTHCPTHRASPNTIPSSYVVPTCPLFSTASPPSTHLLPLRSPSFPSGQVRDHGTHNLTLRLRLSLIRLRIPIFLSCSPSYLSS
jgi:hypothetical protein